MGNLIHSGQVLLIEAEKAFDEGEQERGISLLNNCVEMLTNGLERLKAAQPTPTEQPPQVEQPAESPNAPKPGAIKPRHSI